MRKLDHHSILVSYPMCIYINFANCLSSYYRLLLYISLMILLDIDILEEFMFLANSGVFQLLDILPAGNAGATTK